MWFARVLRAGASKKPYSKSMCLTQWIEWFNSFFNFILFFTACDYDVSLIKSINVISMKFIITCRF